MNDFFKPDLSIHGHVKGLSSLSPPPPSVMADQSRRPSPPHPSTVTHPSILLSRLLPPVVWWLINLNVLAPPPPLPHTHTQFPSHTPLLPTAPYPPPQACALWLIPLTLFLQLSSRAEGGMSIVNLMMYFQPIMRVISLSTSLLCTPPPHRHLYLAISSLPQGVSFQRLWRCKAESPQTRFIFPLKNLFARLLFSLDSFVHTPTSRPRRKARQPACILLETHKKDIRRYKSIDGVTVWGCSWGPVALL